MTGRLYGGFWRRLFAYAVDKVILYLIALLLLLVAIAALVLGGFSAHRIVAGGNPLRGLGPALVLYLGALFLVDMLYFTWFHGSVGQTPGKMLLKLKVVRTSGEEMTFGAAFLRWATTYVSSMFLSLGYLWIALDGRKQGWHDKIAATLVIRTAGRPQPDTPPSAAPPASGESCATAAGVTAPSAAGAPTSPLIAPDPDTTSAPGSAPAPGSDVAGAPGTSAAPGTYAAPPPPEPAPSAETGTGAPRNMP